VGKTTISALLARELASAGADTLAVDCDPNPTLGDELGVASASLARFDRDGLRPADGTLELAREPELIEIDSHLKLLGGPPSDTPLADAVARGIAGVLVADRFEFSVTDLGAGPEFARVAVGGVLNPADLCIVLSDGRSVSELTADRVEGACRAREVQCRRVLNRRGDAGEVAAELMRIVRSG
jgi:MinD-like ATPase involved in chromosome partitioning or flagellar assembly